MNMGKIKISSLNNSSYVVEDSRKSKGKTSLITKIKTFFRYIKNIIIFKSNRDLEKLSDETLDGYIAFLNNENITIEKAVKKINDEYDRKEEVLTPYESLSLASEMQGGLDVLKEQQEKVNSKLEDAMSEKYSREELNDVEQEENEYDSSIPQDADSEEEKELPDVELPMESNETSELPVESEEEIKPIDYEQAIEEATKEELESDNYDNNYTTEELKPVEIPEEPVETKAETPVQEETVTLVEQKDPEEEVMMNIQNDYKNSITNIQNEYTENFSKEFGTIVSKIMVETEKYANRQVEEITAVSKEAINNANNNTQRVLDEKAIVEKDRDQYKAHYEQSLNTVEEKNRTIDSKDAEIKALKEEIERKNQEISTRDKNIQELNTSIAEKDGRIANYESKIEDYKVTLATMTRELGRNFQISSQMNLEEPEVSKTK